MVDDINKLIQAIGARIKPPPPTKQPPTQPTTPPAQPKGPTPPTTPARGRDQKTDDILNPDGKLVGENVGRSGADIKTVSPKEFEDLKSRLLDGAKEVPSAGNYTGKWYERADGSIIGVRNSTQSGKTLDLVRGGSGSTLKSGFKVHQK